MRQFNSTSFVYRRQRLSLRGWLNKSVPIIIHGIVGDEIFENVRRSHFFYESDLLEKIGFVMRWRADMVVDVGANIGNHMLFFSKVLEAKVICVEPNPAALDLLQNNVAVNRVMELVTIVKAAASDRLGTLQLEAGPISNLGMAKVVCGRKDGLTEVISKTVDDIVALVTQKGDPRISLIKIDVEGFELNVLRGSLKTIKEHLPVIVVEAATTDSHRAVENILKQFGYQYLGPYSSTPTYIFCPSRIICYYASSWWFVKRVVNYLVRKSKSLLKANL